MNYKIIPCRNMNDVPDVALARIVSFLDPISQCNVAPVSSVLRQVVAGKTDSKGVPITPEQRRMAAVRYLDAFARDLHDKIRRARFKYPGLVYEETTAMIPSNIRPVLDKQFLKKFSWEVDLLSAVVGDLLNIPGQMDRVIGFSNAMSRHLLDMQQKGRILSQIAIRLVKIPGREDEALEMAMGISAERYKNSALDDIASHMVSLPGQEARAIEIALSIPKKSVSSEPDDRSHALFRIVKTLITLPDYEARALDLIKEISDEEILFYLVRYMLKLPGRESLALEMANGMSGSCYREWALGEIELARRDCA